MLSFVRYANATNDECKRFVVEQQTAQRKRCVKQNALATNYKRNHIFLRQQKIAYICIILNERTCATAHLQKTTQTILDVARVSARKKGERTENRVVGGSTEVWGCFVHCICGKLKFITVEMFWFEYIFFSFSRVVVAAVAVVVVVVAALSFGSLAPTFFS